MATDTFDTPGTTPWVSPITGTVRVRCWGAGAGGGVHTGGEGGGGGGSYAEGDFPVASQQSYDVVVGAGGAVGVPGGDSYIDDGSILYALGGQPGFTGGSAGGAGGPEGLGEIVFPGGYGGNGSTGFGLRGGGGGGAGAGPTGSGSNGGHGVFDAPGAGGIGPGGNGGNGGGSTNNGQDGTAPGGGGGGGGNSGGNGDSLPMVENVWRVYHGRTRATRHKYPGSLADAVHTGTSQGGSPNTIVLDAAASSEDGFYAGMLIRLTGGTGTNQWSKIVDYVGATWTATIEGTWAVTPDATTTFAVIPDKGWYVEYTGYVKAWFAVDSHWLQIASGRPWCYQDGTPGDPYQCIYHWNCWYQGRIDAKWRGDIMDEEFVAWIAAHDAGFGATLEPASSHCHDPLAGLCLPEDSPFDGKAMGDQLWPPAANQDSDSFGAPPGLVETPPCRTLHGKYSWAYLPELGSNHPTTPIAGPVVPQLPEHGLWHQTRTIKKTTPDGSATEEVLGWADLRFVSILPALGGA